MSPSANPTNDVMLFTSTGFSWSSWLYRAHSVTNTFLGSPSWVGTFVFTAGGYVESVDEVVVSGTGGDTTAVAEGVATTAAAAAAPAAAGRTPS